MNGNENAFAGAMFFALMSLGAVLKIDDIMIGGAIGAGCALLATIFLRLALNKSAQASEEDHQRMEIQFQQLRTKIIESTESNIAVTNSLGEIAQIIQENLQFMNDGQTKSKNFTELAKNIESINLALVGLEENSFAVNTGLEKIFVAIQSQQKFTDSDEFKKLLEIEDTNKANIQTAMKILHVIAQTIRNTSYVNEFEKINVALERLGTRNEVFDELKISAVAAQKNLSELVKISGNLSKSFTMTLDDLRLDMIKISAKLEELNSTINKNKAAIEENSNSVKKLRRR